MLLFSLTVHKNKETNSVLQKFSQFRCYRKFVKPSAEFDKCVGATLTAEKEEGGNKEKRREDEEKGKGTSEENGERNQ